eukprot:UN08054
MPNCTVFDEGPSDGFKVGIATWGVIRATLKSGKSGKYPSAYS